MNKVFLIGRLTRDPELRYTSSNRAVCQFTVAIDRPFTNQATGNREADFINVVAWDKTGENIGKYMTKGRLIAVEGRIQTRSYDNNEGRKVYVYWGIGSIDKMEHYEECERLMNRYKVAIFHKKNIGSADMEYINNEHKIGKYDVLISSCYFGVGCDLNDEDKTAVIIVGNNPYQEDEQAIGRFRNSKDIKVNILLDNLYVEKIDVGEQLINENEISNRVNKSLSQRDKSIVRREYGEDYNYMLCAKYYFSDIERKFNFFNDRKYNVLNRYELIYNDYRKRYEYEIQDINGQCIINLLDDVEVLDTILNNRKIKLIEKKHVIYDKLLNGEDIDLYELRENNVSSPKFHDFIDALLVIKNYYNLPRFLHDVSKKSFMKLSKDKMNTLLSFKMKIDSNKVDRTELDLVKKLCSVENKSSSR